MPSGSESNVNRSQHPMPKATVFVLVALCIYWGALFYGTHTKVPQGLLPGHSDKIIHFGSYAGLGVLLLCLRATRGVFSWFSIVGRWVVLACYGAFDELTQLLVNRTADLHDWYADILGAALGLILATAVYWWLRRARPEISALLTGQASAAVD